MFNFKTLVAVAVLVLGGISAANAQIVDNSAIKIAVPSPFVLRGETLPAGVYTIARTPGKSDSPSLLILRGEGETVVFDSMIGPAERDVKNTQLVFDTINGVNYLTDILVKGQSSKNSIVRSKAQTRALASGVAVSKTVMIAETGF